MTPQEWLRVKALLQEALAQPAGARAAFLETACAGDAELLDEVEDLLRFEEENQAGISLPVTKWHDAMPESETPAEADPERAGPYRIVRRLGEGGMGVVYLAERDDGEYRQQVAVKVMKPGADTAGFARRFRRDRQVLAELQHPNIARLIDSGTASNGQLYYVMEYVDGLSVTTYARDHKLTVRQRLQIFRHICSAVTHAHRKLIIHGDIKPGNILVAARGTPKLLDFGLARVFRDSPAADPLPASTVSMLTPDYASPEQVRGERLTTSTDIYSLGVLLYELLCGQSPYSAKEQSPLEIYHAICELEPVRPSAAVRKSTRGEAAIVTAQQLKGDLDDIVLMALRKETEHRYGSVEELERDIERHLSGFPVRASRGSSLYRFRKFVSRHRWGMAVTLAGTLLSIAAAYAIWWQGWQARQRFNDLRQLAHAVVFDLHDAIQDLPGSTAARRLLVERALVYLRTLDASGGKNRDLQMEIALAYDKIGQVQGSPGRANTGDLSGALESYGRARRILQSLLRAAPNDLKIQDALASADEHQADIHEQRGEAPLWRQLRQEATELRWKIANEHPEMLAYRAAALWNEAYTLSGENRPAESVIAYEQALTANLEASAREPDNAALRRATARIHRNLASAYQQTGRSNEALDHHRQAQRIDKERVAAAPRDMRAKLELSWDYTEIGWLLHERHRNREADASFSAALVIQHEMADADPQNSLARLEIGKLKVTAAPTCEDAGDRPRAIRYLQDATRLFEEAVTLDPSNDDARYHLGWAWSDLGDLYIRAAGNATSGWKKASPCFARAAEALGHLKLDGRLEGDLNAKPLITHVSQRLVECRGHQD
jgi:serine/threonine protein kinase/tetratricopeptide (TPR) repeat protein